ncbi:MAG: hypothetical protein PHF86_14220, partial [Candidatus Nanoarchaeia archaeon]|nr:hypothetical protein [Candidatus Nanoarchaeia archaeon]
MRIAYENIIDDLDGSSLTAVSEVPNYEITNIQDDRLSTKWIMDSSATAQSAIIELNTMSEYPDDPAGTTYLQDDWLTTAGWTSDAGVCSVDVNDGQLEVTYISGSSGTYFYHNNFGSPNNGKNCRYKVVSVNPIQNIKYAPSSGVYASVPYTLIDDYTAIVDFVINASWVILILAVNNGIADTGNVLLIDYIYIGTGAYLPGALRDITGNGYDLNVYSAVPVGEELYFNGVNAYLRTRGQVEMPDLFSISGKWIIPSSTVRQTLLYAGTKGNYIAIGRLENTRYLRINWNTISGVTGDSVLDFFPISDTEAVYLEIGFDFPNEIIYCNKNGLKIKEIDISGVIKPELSYWYFSVFGSTYWMSGTLSLLCLWNVIHSPQEVLSHYQNPYGAMPKTIIAEQIRALR